jgi:hypothetical protein
MITLSNRLIASIAVLTLAGLSVTLWAIIDAASTPTSRFREAGSSKAFWIALISVLYFLTVCPGVIMAIVYLWFIRGRLRGRHPHSEHSTVAT